MFLIEGLCIGFVVAVSVWEVRRLRKRGVLGRKVQRREDEAETIAKAIANKICPQCTKLKLVEKLISRRYTYESEFTAGLGVQCAECSWQFKYPPGSMQTILQQRLDELGVQKIAAIINEKL